MAEELPSADARVVDSIFKHIQKVTINSGYMPDVDTFGDTELDANNYQVALDAIQADKGFYIEVFNQSSARRKAAKKTKRIVIYLSRVYDGEIAAPIHAIIDNDKTEGGKFKSGFLPTKSAMLVIAIHLISAVENEFYTLNAIIARTLSQRAYLTYWDKPTNTFIPDQWFICEQTSYNDLDDALEGVFEKVFYYTVSDIYLNELMNVVEVAPIKSITVQQGDEPEFIKVQSNP